MKNTLTPVEKKALKAQAHALKPTVIIGSQGLSENVHHEVELALNVHELIKVRVNAGSKADRQALITTLIEEHDAELIHVIGHIAILYRSKPE